MESHRDRLTDEEKDVWDGLFASLPSNHFRPAIYDLVEAYCKHVVKSRIIDRMITSTTNRDEIDVTALDALYKMSDRENRAIAAMADKLKLHRKGRS